MHDDAAMQRFHVVSKLFFSTFFSSRIMDMNSLQGGAFLSNFSCAYPGTCSTVVPKLRGSINAVGWCPGFDIGEIEECLIIVEQCAPLNFDMDKVTRSFLSPLATFGILVNFCGCHRCV